MDFPAQSERFLSLLGLKRAPVAVSFLSKAPAGVRKLASAAPAGCSYWTLAEKEGAFYTEAADHMNCPVGAHTHGVELPAAKAKELGALVEMMVGLKYIFMDEVPSIPRLQTPFKVAVYAPLGQAPCPPDVVIVRGNARQVMLVAEAARAAGIGHEGAALGRPACAMIPFVLQGGQGAASLGCIGNRVYTGLGDDELYFTFPGAKLPEVLESLETVLKANRALEEFHRGRKAAARN